MKLFNAIAVAAVIGASLGCTATAELAQCSNGWCKAGCGDDGFCNNLKVKSRNYPYVTYMNNHPNGFRQEEADCKQLRWRVWERAGNAIGYDQFSKAKPGSTEEIKIKTVCNEKLWSKSIK